MKKNNLKIFLFALLTILIFDLQKTFAVCPICTVAIGTGVGFTRYIGIDDTITGLWIGGFIVSSGLWLASFLKNKKIKIPYIEILSVILMTAFTIIALYLSKFIGVAHNKIFGVEKIVFGIAIGMIIFFFSTKTDAYLRQKNNGKVIIYYQKVIIPVLFLTLTSFLFYLINW